MNLPDEVQPFAEPLEAMQRLLLRFDEKGVIIGGTAVSMLGRPRYTEDLDAMFLLSVEEIQTFLQAAAEEGVEPRIKNCAEFARKNRFYCLSIAHHRQL